MELKSAIKTLDSLLRESVLKNLPETGKAGLYYSGGIDSGLIDTYHDFERITYEADENIDYEEEFHAKFPKIIKTIGQPIKSFSPFAWWKLGEEAKKKGITTVFSGESADELFSGYIRWLPQALNLQAQEMFPSYKGMFPAKHDINDVGREAFYGDLQFLLDAERRIAKAHGLKIVFPFLDEKIVNFAWSLPADFKIKGFETKVILRRLLEQRNPSYKHIEKRGLFCSVNKWIGSKDGFDKADYLELQNEILYGPE